MREVKKQDGNKKVDCFLDESQQFLDTVQQQNDIAQAKIYIARIQNAFYSGRFQDALQYCDKLKTLAGLNSQAENIQKYIRERL